MCDVNMFTQPDNVHGALARHEPSLGGYSLQ